MNQQPLDPVKVLKLSSPVAIIAIVVIAAYGGIAMLIITLLFLFVTTTVVLFATNSSRHKHKESMIRSELNRNVHRPSPDEAQDPKLSQNVPVGNSSYAAQIKANTSAEDLQHAREEGYYAALESVHDAHIATQSQRVRGATVLPRKKQNLAPAKTEILFMAGLVLLLIMAVLAGTL